MQKNLESVEAAERIYGADSHELCLALEAVTVMLTQTGHYEESNRKLNECLKIRIKLNGYESEKIPSIYYDIGYNYQKMGNHREALKYYTKSAKLKHKNKGRI